MDFSHFATNPLFLLSHIIRSTQVKSVISVKKSLWMLSKLSIWVDKCTICLRKPVGNPCGFQSIEVNRRVLTNFNRQSRFKQISHTELIHVSSSSCPSNLTDLGKYTVFTSLFPANRTVSNFWMYMIYPEEDFFPSILTGYNYVYIHNIYTSLFKNCPSDNMETKLRFCVSKNNCTDWSLLLY